jgi:hypothetical protein
MTKITLIKCDGPNCLRQIDLRIHANTWLQLIIGENVYDFCSYFCLSEYTRKIESGS